MWVWYCLQNLGWTCITQRKPLAHFVFENESCMMIPGTYAEMHEDYD